MTTRQRGVDALTGAAAAAALLAGLARPGYPLLRDMVATPRPALTDAALGFGGSAARAVPQDAAMVSLTSAVTALHLPTWPFVGLLTFACCVWLAVAVGALVRGAGICARTGASGAPWWVRSPAVVAAVWNPYVTERLLQGHWSLLAGLAACATIPALLARPGPPTVRRLAACAGAIALAGITPTGWLLAVLTALVTAAARRDRPRVWLLFASAALVTASPWLLATAFAPSGDVVTTGVEQFAARAERGVGTPGSLLATGGIWNSQAVPASRESWWAPVALALLIAVWVLAAPVLWRGRRSVAIAVPVVTGVAAWAVVSLAATGPGLAALDAVVRAVPPAGLLRDTQKLVAPLVPATALAVAAATARLGAAGELRRAAAAVAVGLVVPLQAPDAPAELWRSLQPVHYGPGWAEVRDLTAKDGVGVLVLPSGMVRATPLWAGGRPVLDPAPRLLQAPVVTTGELVVGGTRAGGSGAGTEAYRLLLEGADPAELTARGIGWVLDERTSAGPRGQAPQTLAAADRRYADDELTLYRLPGEPVPAQRPSQAARSAVVTAHVAWALLVLTALAAAVTRRRAPADRRAPRPAPGP